MALDATALILFSALLHALWAALIKREPDTVVATAGVVGVSTAAATVTALVAAAPAPVGDAALGWTAAAGLCEGAYFVTLAQALARAPLGLAYTVIRGGAMLVVWPVSVLWLAEGVDGGALAGATLVGLGMVVLHVDRGALGQPARLGAAYACAACVAGYHLCYGRALALGVAPLALFALALWVALPIKLLWLGRDRCALLVQRLRRRPARLLVAGGVCTTSFVIFLVGLAQAGAGAALTLRNTSVLFAVGLGLLLGEPWRPRHLVGAGLVCGGAALVSWPR